MKLLTSKLQHKNFETGEFIEEQKRSLEDLIQLIEEFPWENERDRIVIDLTNPSVTIEGENDDHLKLAVYYNQKFVLHYLDPKKVLFDKSFIDIRDSYKYLENYYAGTFTTADFKKQNTWLKPNLKHFVSQNFQYSVTPESARKYLFSTSGMNFGLSIFIIFISILYGNPLANIGINFFFLIFMFLMGGGLNLFLFYNYYRQSKGKTLIMSKGNEEFYYGDKEAPTKYNKKDILQFTLIETRSHRSPVQGFAFIKIEFKDGSIIKIPNIFADRYRLVEKLFQNRQIYKGRFPYMK